MLAISWFGNKSKEALPVCKNETFLNGELNLKAKLTLNLNPDISAKPAGKAPAHKGNSKSTLKAYKTLRVNTLKTYQEVLSRHQYLKEKDQELKVCMNKIMKCQNPLKNSQGVKFLQTGSWSY